MHNLPDLARSFEKMKLQQAISENLHDSVFAEMCRKNIYDQYEDTIRMIIDQLADNPALTARILGADAILRVASLYTTTLTPYQLWQLRTFGDICPDRPAGGEWNGQVPDYRKQQYDMQQEGYAI